MAGKAQGDAALTIPPEHTGDVKRPQTGQEYLESLRDDRTVYIYGERVKDVTQHPAFRNTARMVARLYDALHDEKRKHKLLLPTETGNGGMTHAFFKAPKSMDDLIAGRSAIAEWARITYGWMGRAPDYKAAFLATLGANSDFYEPYQDNAKRWYKFSQERVPFINHAIIHPLPCRKGDRRRHCCLRRKGRRDGIGADELHLRRASRPDSAAGQEVRGRVHGADQCARRKVHLPHVLRDERECDGKSV
jgi:hypothetical protein